MVKYAYFFLITVYVIYLLLTLLKYVIKPAPGGDASVGWAWGIIYAGIVFGIVLIALLFWKKQPIGLIILCIPVLLLAPPAIRHKLTDLYAFSPSFTRVPALVLTIKNSTTSSVHVQLNCWFSTANANRYFLYKTLDYTISPLETRDHTLSSFETRLLAVKSSYISIMIYECIEIQHNGVAYTKEIQPCMQFFDEKPGVFKLGKYLLQVDSDRNTTSFLKEVELLKKEGLYRSEND